MRVAFFPGFMGDSCEGDFLKALPLKREVLSFDLHSEIRNFALRNPHFSFSFPTSAPSLLPSLLKNLYTRVKSFNPHILYGYSRGGRIIQDLLDQSQASELSNLHTVIFESSSLLNLSPQERIDRQKWDERNAHIIRNDFPQFLHTWYALALWGNLCPLKKRQWIENKESRYGKEEERFSLAWQILALSPAYFNLPLFDALVKKFQHLRFFSFSGEEDLKYKNQADKLSKLNLSNFHQISISHLGHNLHAFAKDYTPHLLNPLT